MHRRWEAYQVKTSGGNGATHTQNFSLGEDKRHPTLPGYATLEINVRARAITIGACDPIRNRSPGLDTTAPAPSICRAFRSGN